LNFNAFSHVIKFKLLKLKFLYLFLLQVTSIRSYFLSEAHLAKSFPELQEVISQAKLLEMDIDAWLSRKGRTTLSLEWPVIS
jgi:hypothetical protein